MSIRTLCAWTAETYPFVNSTALFDKLRPMTYYLGKLRLRMEQKRFPEGDELSTLIHEAETAMQRLTMHVNSLAGHKSRHRKRTDLGE